MAKKPSLHQVTTEAIEQAALQPQDRAAAALAAEYAAAIDDDAGALETLGPKLLAALTALGMTVAGRGAKGVGNGTGVASKLDELRERRERRARGNGA